MSLSQELRLLTAKATTDQSKHGTAEDCRLLFAQNFQISKFKTTPCPVSIYYMIHRSSWFLVSPRRLVWRAFVPDI
jgi:hypothetical protein